VCWAKAGEFEGPGHEYSVETAHELGLNGQWETDDEGNFVGAALGVAVGEGAGYFEYETDTTAFSLF
jgi:hypothetical protein